MPLIAPQILSQLSLRKPISVMMPTIARAAKDTGPRAVTTATPTARSAAIRIGLLVNMNWKKLWSRGNKTRMPVLKASKNGVARFLEPE